jgi:hypothetical protein
MPDAPRDYWTPRLWELWTAALIRPIRVDDEEVAPELCLRPWWVWLADFRARYGAHAVERKNPEPGPIPRGHRMTDLWAQGYTSVPCPTDACFYVAADSPQCSGACIPGCVRPLTATDWAPDEFGDGEGL